MSETGNPIQHKLAAARSEWWRTTRVLSGVGWTVVAVVVLSLICYHADSRLVLSAGAREVWRLGIVGGPETIVLFADAVLRSLTAARCRTPWWRRACRAEISRSSRTVC